MESWPKSPSTSWESVGKENPTPTIVSKLWQTRRKYCLSPHNMQSFSNDMENHNFFNWNANSCKLRLIECFTRSGKKEKMSNMELFIALCGTQRIFLSLKERRKIHKYQGLELKQYSYRRIKSPKTIYLKLRNSSKLVLETSSSRLF